jgi:hypothetical protein
MLDDPMRYEPAQAALLREQVNSLLPGVELWGAFYVHLLDDSNQNEIVQYLDGFTLATWDPEDLHTLDQDVARLAEKAPGKPIVYVLYMYDYQNDRKMPRELMQLQCEKSLALAKEGRLRGLVFLAVNNDPDTIIWTRDWIREHAEEPVIIQ